MSHSYNKSYCALKLLLKLECYLSVFEGYNVQALLVKVFQEHCVILQHFVKA